MSPPAPPADVMTPDVPERAPPASDPPEDVTPPVRPPLPPDVTLAHDPADTGETSPPASVPADALTQRDAVILFQALARLARVHGYSDEHLPEFASDFDSSDADPRIAALVTWAKQARLP